MVGRLLLSKLSHSAFLDGDDVWQINPFEVTEITKGIVERNVASILRNYLEANYEYVILAWVLHQQSITDRLLSRLDDLKFNVHVFTLIADEGVLIRRLQTNKGRGTDPNMALDRLRQSLKLRNEKIDTTMLGPEVIVDRILNTLSEVPRVN